MDNVLETLRERGFVKQCTDEEGLARALSNGTVVYYCGFDPTAESLHVGNLLTIMANAHLQRAGHKPIALVGGGTAMVGDPSGKTEMRKMLTREQIEHNASSVHAQLSRYLKLDGTSGIPVNNSDWLLDLKYIEFLRDIGRHFRVNEMLRSEAYRMRLEREEGLSFIEFNYQLLQAYDYLVLSREHGCTLQIGGDDQWGNILAGVDLVRRLDGREVFAFTIPLLTTSSGEKMGKTARGAVWLDAEKLSPYEFYQFWINTDDRDVERFLALFTFLPMDEVRRLGALRDADIREAKETLAFEATKISHGEDEAVQAREASRAAFGGDGGDIGAVPTTSISAARLSEGIPVLDLLVETGLTDSKGAARRLIRGGGAYVGGQQVRDEDMLVRDEMAEDGALMLRLGKKRHHRLVIE